MRYLNLGTVSAPRSQAVYHAVAQEMSQGDELTLITVSPREPYVCVGHHQVTSREVDVEYCFAQGIPVGRRMTGGGAVYLDYDQIFWHLVIPQQFVNVEQLYEKYLQAPVRTYQRMGIPARHRPVNDLVVGARKIGGTGAANIAEATVLVGSIMMDFNIAAMAKVLRVPSEKFRDKLVSGLEEYMTSIKREMGDRPLPDREQVTEWLVEGFADILGEPVVHGTLREAEQTALKRLESQLFSTDFVFRSEGILLDGVKISGDVRLYEGVHKAPGGLIRLIYRERGGVFDDVLLAGDFFVYPEESLQAFTEGIIGQEVAEQNFILQAKRLLERSEMPGVGLDDLLASYRAANSTNT
ncbi:lipoate--protein ligase family protein [Ferviditalea candida]|uniref:Lipoate--protein ligase family protein n=1 Tax=Ferviditalea candida TaxID=3108399 RepID=A0ABU5ZKG0_9BACL|nr:lipoate--protein ligase family protein [Paenibacillaceae bacterium T2]